jgi:hypothetical protein
LIRGSNKQGKQKALRRKPVEAADSYRSFIVERWAVGADSLAKIWATAWNEAGRPDLTGYESFKYPLKPDFIVPSYLDSVPKNDDFKTNKK